jgi:hypothetical protein
MGPDGDISTGRKSNKSLGEISSDVGGDTKLVVQ